MRMTLRESVVGCKLHAIFGNALFLYHNMQGSKNARRHQVSIFETSTVPGLQTKAAILFHGMPKSENAFGIRTYETRQAQSLATLTPKELQHDILMFGLAVTVLTRSLLRKLENMELSQLSLSKLSRRCLARLVQHTFLSASHDLQAVTFNLSALLAFGHDKAESSPIVGTCLENVYLFNGWHDNTTNHLLYVLQVVLSLGMTHVASTLLSGALMDRAGRRPLLLVSIALMCAGLQGTAHARDT